MPIGCGKRKLRRGSYHAMTPPGLAAREANRSTIFRTFAFSFVEGTDGKSKVTLSGEKKLLWLKFR
jgi:hypothetical protein